MVTVEPKKRVADQKTAHFMAAVIENITVPLGLNTLARVGVLENMRAVKISESVLVAREMRRHPIEDHADVVLMQCIDEKHQILRRAVVCRRGEISGDLIAPGTEKGMVHQRQKFHVSETRVPHIIGKQRRHLAVGKRAVAFLNDAPPRAKVYFIDRNRRSERSCAICGRPSTSGRSTNTLSPRRSKPFAAESR